MQIAIVHNIAKTAVLGRDEDLASDREMEIIPELVAEELSHRGYRVTLVAADWDLIHEVSEASPYIVLNLAEGFAGTNGHEHLVPCLLDFAGVPYTGADATNMAILRDKVFTKELLASRGVKTPRYQVFENAAHPRVEGLTFPLILKPIHEEASIGIRLSSVVRNQHEFQERLPPLLAAYKQAILAEEFIVGQEISVGVWGNNSTEVLPACEFTFEGSNPLSCFRSFEYKWQGAQEIMRHACSLSRSAHKEVCEVARLAHVLFRCRDYSRSDFRVSEDDTVYFLEHNFNPGIGPNTHGLSNTFTRMAELAGISFGDMLERIIMYARERYD